MYRTVTDLTRDELNELKGNYLCELAGEGERDFPSWADIANADEIISDETIFEHYAGIGFVEDDFFCNLTESND